VEDVPTAGGRLLLDACVYVDQLKGRAPPAVEALIEARTVLHSALSLAELAFTFGRLDAQNPRTPAVLKVLERLLAAVPAHRVVAADA
jgi:predicted nucleic acid-binding protein